jgi:VanZ family protein
MQKNFDKKRCFYLFMTLIVAAIIFCASMIKPTMETTKNNFSIIYHFGVFFMFTFFLFLTIKKEKADIKIMLIVFLISVVYAFSDEIHQFFVPGRFVSLKDILIDGAGNLCAIFLINRIDKFYKT